MSRKGKIEIEEKIKIVCECIEGELSQTQAAEIVGVHHETIREWIARYQAEGSLGLSNIEQHNRVYSKELKLRAVEAYLSGEGSILEICKKYQIRSKRQLRDWIKVYNIGCKINYNRVHNGKYLPPVPDNTLVLMSQIIMLLKNSIKHQLPLPSQLELFLFCLAKRLTQKFY